MQQLHDIFAIGQRVGGMRDDLPIPVLQQLWMSVNEVMERYLLAEWETADHDRMDELFAISVDMFKSIFVPRKDKE